MSIQIMYPSPNVSIDPATSEIRCSLCKRCRAALVRVHSKDRKPNVHVPDVARCNGMWRGPDPQELSSLSYCEAKVINLARVYVSVKRVFLDRRSYAGTSFSEAPLYHQRNVVAYPQNPDAALTALGMSPSSLASTLQVQFVGENRADLRHAPDLQVSVPKLRRAFRWLSVNSWPFMEATRDHALWESGSLERSLEELLQAYVQIRRRGRMIGPDQGDTFCFLAHTACQAGCRALFECLFAWAS